MKKFAVLMGLFLLCVPACSPGRDAVDSSAPGSGAETAATAPGDLISFAEPTADGDRYGYRDATGRVRIEPRFRLADEFSGSGLAAVVDESGWAYIDVKGEVVVRPFVFDNGPDPFSEGLARFEREGRFGFFGERGQVAIEPRFDFARPFSEGLSAVCMGCVSQSDGEHSFVTGGKWGYIRSSGEEAIPLLYEKAGPFEEGRALVVEGGAEKWIGKDGQPLPQ